MRRTPSRAGELEGLGILVMIVIVALILVGGIGGCMYVQPNYNVWSSEKEGQAEYAKAEANRKIAILEAEAKKQAAQSLAEAEVIRAEGVAKANKIIGDSLNQNELYLHYLWINNLHDGRNDVIYVSTEAGIPIMEAGRRHDPLTGPQKPSLERVVP